MRQAFTHRSRALGEGLVSTRDHADYSHMPPSRKPIATVYEEDKNGKRSTITTTICEWNASTIAVGSGIDTCVLPLTSVDVWQWTLATGATGVLKAGEIREMREAVAEQIHNSWCWKRWEANQTLACALVSKGLVHFFCHGNGSPLQITTYSKVLHSTLATHLMFCFALWNQCLVCFHRASPTARHLFRLDDLISFLKMLRFPLGAQDRICPRSSSLKFQA